MHSPEDEIVIYEDCILGDSYKITEDVSVYSGSLTVDGTTFSGNDLAIYLYSEVLLCCILLSSKWLKSNKPESITKTLNRISTYRCKKFSRPIFTILDTNFTLVFC